MYKRTLRRGVVLLQTLVISVILSMISVMVLKWVLGRYMMATRSFRSNVSKISGHGVFNSQFPTWPTSGVPANVTASVPQTTNGASSSQCVRIRTSGSAVTITVIQDPDNPSDCPP